ncbi:hypothetical protein EsH8_V_000118 [Colletotrichum jinshuiense]
MDTSGPTFHALSPFDMATSRKYVTRSFVFDFENTAFHLIESAANVIAMRLEGVFLRYPFLSGHIKIDKDGLARLHPRRRPKSTSLPPLTFSNYKEDVFRFRTHSDFFGATVEGLRKKAFPPHWLRRELTCYLPKHVDWSVGMPAMTLQANFLAGKSGYLILSFAIYHCLVDSTSMNLVLQAFAADPFQGVTPVHGNLDLTQYRPRFPLAIREIPEWDFDTEKPVRRSYLESKSKSIIITMPTTRLNRLKEEVDAILAKQGDGRWVSKMDCLGAWCWLAIMRARLPRVDVKAKTKFSTAVNVRSRLRPPLPETFFRNMTVNVVATSTVERLLGPRRDSAVELEPEDDVLAPLPVPAIASAAASIRDAIEAVNDEYVCQRLGALAQAKPEEIKEVTYAFARTMRSSHTGVKFRSFSASGADLDFGIPSTTNGRRPIFCRKQWGTEEGVVSVLPRTAGSADGDPGWEIQMCLSLDDFKELRKFLEGWVGVSYC